MAVRDPYFWKRFSAAVHASEVEQAAAAATTDVQAKGKTRTKTKTEMKTEVKTEAKADTDGKMEEKTEEAGSEAPSSTDGSTGSGSETPEKGEGKAKAKAKAKPAPSWLARQHAKEARRTLICWLFWLLFAALVGGVVAVLFVLRRGRGRGWVL